MADARLLAACREATPQIVDDLWMIVVGYAVPAQAWMITGAAAVDIARPLSTNEFELVPLPNNQSPAWANWSQIYALYDLQPGEGIRIEVKSAEDVGIKTVFPNPWWGRISLGVAEVDIHNRPKILTTNCDFITIRSNNESSVLYRGGLSDPDDVANEMGDITTYGWEFHPDHRGPISAFELRRDENSITALMYSGPNVSCQGRLSTTKKRVHPYVSFYYYKDSHPNGWKFKITSV